MDTLFEDWAAENRSVWFIKGDQTLYGGIWEVVHPYDGESMRLKSLVDWPYESPDWVEVHKIEERRQDYHDIADLEQAFRSVMCIRPVVSEPTKKISDDPEDPHVGRRVIFSFILMLSKPFSLVEGEFSTK
jgi:hypothetical protein